MNQELDIHLSAQSEPVAALVPTYHFFEPLIGTVEAAVLFGGIHPKTLERWARKRLVPAHKIGRCWFFRASELDELIKSNIGFLKANNTRVN